MIKGNFFVNSKNAYDYYGILVADKGYKGIATPAPMKNVEFNDWPEEDGIEPDLTSPVLDARSFDIDFLCVDETKIHDFFTEISQSGLQEFDFTELNQTVSLRLTGEKNLTKLGKGETFSLSFVEDKPLDGYVYVLPSSNQLIDQGYLLDGISFLDYGLVVGEMINAELRKASNVKTNLIVNSQYHEGTGYDSGILKYQDKDVKINLLFRADSAAEFWKNYKALFYNLKQSGERTLTTPRGNYQCFYKSGKSNRLEKLISGGIWCEIDITLTILSYRP